jgi:hypothetical protein
MEDESNEIWGKAAGGRAVTAHLVCVCSVLNRRELNGGKDTMLLFQCPGVARPLDIERENIVSCTPARPPKVPFWGREW